MSTAGEQPGHADVPASVIALLTFALEVDPDTDVADDLVSAATAGLAYSGSQISVEVPARPLGPDDIRRLLQEVSESTRAMVEAHYATRLACMAAIFRALAIEAGPYIDGHEFLQRQAGLFMNPPEDD